MEGYYSAVDAAKLAGITRRQLDYWVSIELIEPAITAPRGKAGTVKLFDFDNLFQLRILKALMDAGFSIQALRKITYDDYDDQEKNVPEKRPFAVSSKSEPVSMDMQAMVETFYDSKEFKKLTVLTPEGLIRLDLATIYEELRQAVTEEVRPRQEKAGSLKAKGVKRFEPGKVKKKEQA